MKRYTALLLILCCLWMAACGAPASESPPIEEDVPPASPVCDAAGDPVQIKNTQTGEEAALSPEDGDAVLQLLDNRGWIGESTDCASDITVITPEQTYTYHSDCGSVRLNDTSTTLGEMSRQSFNAILSKYVSLDETCLTPFDWGITLTTENVLATGLTIRCTQSGGEPTGELSTGSYYVLERKTEAGWEPVEYAPQEYEIAWTAEGWIIPMNGDVTWDVDWIWLYGTLPEGAYRIGKEIMDWRAPGDYDTQMAYAEFEVPELLICDGLPLA